MSHELRTPLNAIIGFTRIVRRKGEDVLPQKQTENLDKVLTSAEHLLGLINTVLDISKIEAGRMDVLAANFRIGALIELCANTSQPLLKPGVVLEKQVDERLDLIYSDQDKLRQIVLNLLSNAAKFTSEGKVVLSARPEGEANLRISVADTGIGINAEALPRIFEEFQQADNSTTREYGGTGLGLSISRNLAHLLGGDLTAESEPGKGSTFTLTIPIAVSAQGGCAAGREHRGLARLRRTADEDHPDRRGHRPQHRSADADCWRMITRCSSPRTARRAWRWPQEKRPDLIIMDIALPVMDGYEATRRIRCEIPVHCRSWGCLRMPWQATRRKPGPPAATTTSPNRSMRTCCVRRSANCWGE